MAVTTLKATHALTFRGHAPLLRLQSDENLVELTRQGNERAFETLLTRYKPRLLAFCRHMLRSNEDAEDVLQEVFAASYNALLADSREINVRPWLYRIARNRSLNHLRRVRPQASDLLDEQLSEHGKTAADQVHQREEFRQLIADIQVLPESQRTALLLREVEALSYDQIAEAMETTVGAVKSLLVRARVSLAELAQVRALSCEDVLRELGEVAEGLSKLTSPVRKHINKCDGCTQFQKHIKQNNKALAALAPIGPLLLLKKLFFIKGASSAIGGAGASTASGGASASAGLSGLFQASIGAITTKTSAGLAAAALITAGAVEVEKHHPVKHEAKTPVTLMATAPTPSSTPPVALDSTSQPASQAVSAQQAAEPASTQTASTLPPTSAPTTTTDGMGAPVITISPESQGDTQFTSLDGLFENNQLTLDSFNEDGANLPTYVEDESAPGTDFGDQTHPDLPEVDDLLTPGFPSGDWDYSSNWQHKFFPPRWGSSSHGHGIHAHPKQNLPGISKGERDNSLPKDNHEHGVTDGDDLPVTGHAHGSQNDSNPIGTPESKSNNDSSVAEAVEKPKVVFAPTITASNLQTTEPTGLLATSAAPQVTTSSETLTDKNDTSGCNPPSQITNAPPEERTQCLPSE